MTPVQIAVCGPGACSDAERAAAHEVGVLLARAGAVVICGGGGGVMAAVAEGARAAGGIVIGVRPGGRDGAHPDVSAVVATGMGEARNAVIVRSADAVIVIGGSWGTLSELALARRIGVPVVGLGSWTVRDAHGEPLPDAVPAVATPVEAVRCVLEARPGRPDHPDDFGAAARS